MRCPERKSYSYHGFCNYQQMADRGGDSRGCQIPCSWREGSIRRIRLWHTSGNPGEGLVIGETHWDNPGKRKKCEKSGIVFSQAAKRTRHTGNLLFRGRGCPVQQPYRNSHSGTQVLYPQRMDTAGMFHCRNRGGQSRQAGTGSALGRFFRRCHRH